MKKTVILLFLISLTASAQEGYYTPFNPKADENTYGIKAKILPFFIGNSMGIYTSLGTEIGFLKNQSFTAEWFFNYGHGSNDEVTDRYGNEHDSGNLEQMNEHALQLGYRYYYGIQALRARKVVIYNGLFGRAEQTLLKFDKNYADIPYINRRLNVRAFGITTGILQRFKHDPHFGMDYNVSLGKSFTKSDTYNISDDGNTTFSTKNKHDSFYFNLGISINYWF